MTAIACLLRASHNKQIWTDCRSLRVIWRIPLRRVLNHEYHNMFLFQTETSFKRSKTRFRSNFWPCQPYASFCLNLTDHHNRYPSSIGLHGRFLFVDLSSDWNHFHQNTDKHIHDLNKQLQSTVGFYVWTFMSTKLQIHANTCKYQNTGYDWRRWLFYVKRAHLGIMQKTNWNGCIGSETCYRFCFATHLAPGKYILILVLGVCSRFVTRKLGQAGVRDAGD